MKRCHLIYANYNLFSAHLSNFYNILFLTLNIKTKGPSALMNEYLKVLQFFMTLIIVG